MVVLLGRRSNVLPAVGRPCRGCGIPRGAACPEACSALLRGRAARDVPPGSALLRPAAPRAPRRRRIRAAPLVRVPMRTRPLFCHPAKLRPRSRPPPAFRPSPKRAALLAGRRSGKRSRRQKASGWSFLPSGLREGGPRRAKRMLIGRNASLQLPHPPPQERRTLPRSA